MPNAPGAEEQPCRLLLVGMMGSGKSTIGRLLAEATGWPYVDNDELVRRATGTTARRILAERGEAAMREAESAALRLGVRAQPPAIVGIAAGTILDPSDRAALDGAGIVVWLHADPSVLHERAQGADHRPWLDADRDGEAWMRATAVEREPLYRSIADITLDTGRGTEDEVVRELRGQVASYPACG